MHLCVLYTRRAISLNGVIELCHQPSCCYIRPRRYTAIIYVPSNVVTLVKWFHFGFCSQ